MAFTPKSWQNSPTTTTPISAAALVDLETRVTDYPDLQRPDTPAKVQTAIDAAAAAGGGTVYASAPVYTLTTPWVLPSYVDLVVGRNSLVTQGNGQNLAALLMSTNFASLENTNSSSGVARSSVRGGKWDGNKANNTSVATKGIALYGYLLSVSDVNVRNCKGRGLHSEWGNLVGYAPDDAGVGVFEEGVHNFYTNINCMWNSGGGFYLNGPFDCSLVNINSGYNDLSYTYSNIHLGSRSGAALLTGCHAFSHGKYAFQFDQNSSPNCINCHAEGGNLANVYVGSTSMRWIGGRSFSDVSWADSADKGFLFASDAYSVFIDGVSIEGCASGAIDLSSGGGANSHIGATIVANAGTTLLVGNPDGITWDLDGFVGTVPAMDVLPPASAFQSWRRPVFNDTRHDRFTVFMEDDFLVSGGAIGDFGWTIAGGTATAGAAQADHLGIISVATGATINTLTNLSLGVAGGVLMPTSKPYTSEFVFALSQTDVNTEVRIGFANSTTSPPTDGIYLEKLAADTNWFYVNRAAGTQTRTDSGVAASTAWVRFKMRYFWTGSANAVKFSINSGTETVTSTNLTAVALGVVTSIKNTAATNKIFLFDWFRLEVVGISR